MAGIKINQYPLERLTFGDDDYYDIDYWNGSAFETAKIKGSVIKTAIQAGITSANIMDTNSLVLAGDFTHDLNEKNLVFDDGSVRVTNGDLGVLGGFNATHDGVGGLPIASFISSGGNEILVVDNGNEGVAIGTGAPSNDVILDIESTSKAVLLPRLDTTQRNNISTPLESMIIYNTTTNQFEFYSSSATWEALGGGGGDSIYTANGTVPSSTVATITDTLRFKDGTFEIQGVGTTTGTTLALYDNDTTPVKIWEFLDNGKIISAGAVSIGKNQTFNDAKTVSIGDTIANNGDNVVSLGDALSTTGDFTLNIGSGGTVNGDYSAAIGVDSTVSGVQNFAYGTDNSLTGTKNVGIGVRVVSTKVNTVGLGFRIQSTADGASVIGYGVNTSNKLTNNTADSLALGWGVTTPQHLFTSNSAILNGSAKVGTEDISLQGSTLINDTLDMNNNRILNAVINPSVQEAANSATFTINADEQSDGVLTAMSADTTIAAPTGTPVQSQDLVFRFKDNGTARVLAWNLVFRAIGVTLPTTTVADKLTYVGCKYNSTDSKWDVVAVQQEA